MRPLSTRCLFLVGTLCWLAVLLPATQAGEYGYPRENPAFNVTLPEGWTVTERPGPAHLLLCSPAGDTSYIVSLITVPNVGSQDDLNAMLTRITKAGASGAGLTDLAVSPAAEQSIGPGARVFTRVVTSGQNGGITGQFGYYAFNVVSGGRYYAVGAAGLQAIVDAHREDFERIALSIHPLKPQ